ncbi:hypothetical protein B7R87_18390 [Streptomyces tsukubensis]|nr:hypothetical protein B7R87_18390 [Streptomyces tsukubensis]
MLPAPPDHPRTPAPGPPAHRTPRRTAHRPTHPEAARSAAPPENDRNPPPDPTGPARDARHQTAHHPREHPCLTRPRPGGLRTPSPAPGKAKNPRSRRVSPEVLQSRLRDSNPRPTHYEGPQDHRCWCWAVPQNPVSPCQGRSTAMVMTPGPPQCRPVRSRSAHAALTQNVANGGPVAPSFLFLLGRRRKATVRVHISAE